MALVFAGGVGVAWYATRPYPCRATFERVKEGMTRAEVEATVGGPPGSYRSEFHPDLIEDGSWFTDDADLYVWFGDDGRVVQTHVHVGEMQSPTYLTRLRKRLGW